MKICSTVILRELEVVNVCTGEKLGYPTDFEFSSDDARLCALVIPKDQGFLGFGKQTDYVIPWCKIECIGEDTILVKLSAPELSSCCQPRRKREKHL